MKGYKVTSERQRFILFWSYIDIKSKNKCWLWLGGTVKEYGSFCWPGYDKDNPNRRTFYAHRIAYELWWGKALESKLGCHKCDNPPCCNPWHVIRGSHQDNSDHMIEKGRAKFPGPKNPASGKRNGSRTHPECLVRGKDHPNFKITKRLKLKVINRCLAKKYSKRQIAKHYRISISSVFGIIRWARKHNHL